MTDSTLKYLSVFRRAVLLALVSGVPIIFLWGVTFDPFNVPKLALLSAGVGLAGAARLTEAAFGRGSNGLKHLAAPAAFIAVPLTGSWLVNPHKSWMLLGEHTRFEGVVPYLLVIAAGVLLADAFAGRPLSLAWAWVAAGAAVGTYALLQALGLDPLHLPIDPYLASTVGHGNFLGGFLAITLPVALAIWIGGLKGSKLAALSTILIGMGLALTLSQGAWAAGVAGSAIVIGSFGRQRVRIAPALGIGVAALVAAAVLGNVALAALAPDSSLVGGTTRARAEWWKSAIEMGMDAPVLGHGPNTYALKSPMYRTPIDALAHGNLLSNAPHSVPLSFFANTGTLGLLGFLAVLAWATKRWRHFLHGGDSLQAAFLAGVVAYAVQSLVSLDQFLLAFALWVSLAGVGSASVSSLKKPDRTHNAPGRWVTGGVFAGALLLTVAGTAFAARLIKADSEALKGARAFNSGDLESGRRHLNDALSLIDQDIYRFTLGARLGSAGIDEGRDGRDLILEMRSVLEPLRDIDHLHSINSEGRALQMWSVHDRDLRAEALEVLRRATEIDPYNPEIKVWLGQTLMHLDRAEEAATDLGSFVTIVEEYPRFKAFTAPVWAVLALAEHELGRTAEAASHLDRAVQDARLRGTETSDCSVVIARIVVGDETDLVQLPKVLACPRAVREALML